MIAQLARENIALRTIGSELESNSSELDWVEFRSLLVDRLHALGQLDGVALEVEASTLFGLLAHGRRLLGFADPFGQEIFEASTPPVVLLRALARIARIATAEPELRLD